MARIALTHQLRKRRLHPLEVSQADTHIGQAHGGQFGRLAAISAVLKFQDVNGD